MTRNQSGFAHILFILILLAGIGIAVYLTQFTQVFKPKASGNTPNFTKMTGSVFADGQQRYSYAPSIIKVNGQYHAFYCSAPVNEDGSVHPYEIGGSVDYVRHITSSDGTNWSGSPPSIVLKTQISGAMPAFRLHNPNNSVFYYTPIDSERADLVNHGWQYDANYPKWYVYNSQAPGTTAVYRLNNPNNGAFYYTTSDSERADLVNHGWQYDANYPKWYVYNSQAPGTTAVYRVLNPNSGIYYYTKEAGEKDGLIQAGWQDRGIPFFAKADGSLTNYAACDPDVVFFGGYYYMFFTNVEQTGSDHTIAQNYIAVARSQSIDGPYLTLAEDGQWLLNPPTAKALIKPMRIQNQLPQGGGPGHGGLGASWESVVVKGNTLQMWYVDDSETFNYYTPKMYMVESTDPASWNGAKTPVAGMTGFFHSPVVKYNPSTNTYFMADIREAHTYESRLETATSPDGINWTTQTLLPSGELPHFSHNVGVSSDQNGYLLNEPMIYGFGAPYNNLCLGSTSCNDTTFQWDLYSFKHSPVVPVNAVWSAWSACSVTCGQGTQTRTCTEAQNGGTPCSQIDGGNSTRACSMPACPTPPVNAVWSAWSPAVCPVACGTGTQTRTCTEQQNGGIPCSQTDGGNASRSCNTQACAQPLTNPNPEGSKTAPENTVILTTPQQPPSGTVSTLTPPTTVVTPPTIQGPNVAPSTGIVNTVMNTIANIPIIGPMVAPTDTTQQSGQPQGGPAPQTETSQTGIPTTGSVVQPSGPSARPLTAMNIAQQRAQESADGVGAGQPIQNSQIQGPNIPPTPGIVETVVNSFRNIPFLGAMIPPAANDSPLPQNSQVTSESTAAQINQSVAAPSLPDTTQPSGTTPLPATAITAAPEQGQTSPQGANVAPESGIAQTALNSIKGVVQNIPFIGAMVMPTISEPTPAQTGQTMTTPNITNTLPGAIAASPTTGITVTQIQAQKTAQSPEPNASSNQVTTGAGSAANPVQSFLRNIPIIGPMIAPTVSEPAPSPGGQASPGLKQADQTVTGPNISNTQTIVQNNPQTNRQTVQNTPSGITSPIPSPSALTINKQPAQPTSQPNLGPSPITSNADRAIRQLTQSSDNLLNQEKPSGASSQGVIGNLVKFGENIINSIKGFFSGK